MNKREGRLSFALGSLLLGMTVAVIVLQFTK